jgi:hypothetical protein
MLTEDRKTRPVRRTRRGASGSTYWTIEKQGNSRMVMLTIDRGGRKALPVFTYKEEAELFLGLGTLGAGWRIRESGAGELVSVLCGYCKDVEVVALDPLPEVAAVKMIGCVSLSRERFMDLVIARGSPSPHRSDRGPCWGLDRNEGRRTLARSLRRPGS